MSGCRAALLTVTMLAFAPSAEAQQVLASHTLLGKVSDTAGKALAGVTVELASPAANNSVRTVTTDAAGRYRIDRVLPGIYVLTFRLSGFGIAIRDVEIGAGGEPFEFDVKLQPSTPASGSNPVPQQPRRRVVCGMTVISPPPGIDPGIVAPKTPPNTTPVKPTIRTIQPTLCWESADVVPIAPKR